MKKRLSLFALAILSVLGLQAQMIAYSVQPRIEGAAGEPTVVDLQGTTGSDFSGLLFDADEGLNFNAVEDVTAFPIGFEFAYNNQKMTHFLIGSDGYIQLFPEETVSSTANTNGLPSLFSSANNHDIIGIGLRQGLSANDDTQVSYWVEGTTEGQRTLAVQWKNVDIRTSGFPASAGEIAAANALIEIRLYESNGNVEIKVSGFKPEATGNYHWMRIGILGDAGDRLLISNFAGTAVTAGDASISYTTDSYPADGTVYSFVAPEACVAPATAPTDLVLTSTSTQISGTFTVGSADYYLVLATTEAELSESPANGKKYALNDELGNAKVIAIVSAGEFTSPQTYANLLTPGTTYNVFVWGYNSLCLNGPLYGTTPAIASLATKPSAPESLTTTTIDQNSIKVASTSSGSDIIIAVTDEVAKNTSNQILTYGVFGNPTGTYSVGDEIEGGGKVVYIGSTTDGITVDGLEAGKTYFFRAWSVQDGNYSTVYQDANDVTVADLPWSFDLAGAPVGEAPFGWSQSEGSVWSGNERSGYFYNQVNGASADEPAEVWRETSYIQLGEGSNWLSVQIGANEIPWRFASNWTMAEGDVIAIQATTDGVEYKDILKLDKDSAPSVVVDEESGETVNWQNGEFTAFKVNFSEYAGEKVKLRLYIKRQSNGQVQFKDLAVEGTVYSIVGELTGGWDADVDMTQSPDDKNVYTAIVEGFEAEAKTYQFKLRSNHSWDGYQIPEVGNIDYTFTEAGTYTLVFTADVAANTLTLSAQRPYEVSFANEAGWTNVYAYTWIEDEDGNVIAEPSGAWPGTQVEVSGGWFSRSWTYNFTSEQQPQYIIWNNGGGYPDYGEEAAQTDDLVFVNGKKYSVYPDITSVKISGAWNGWDGPEMTVTEYNDKAYETTVDLTSVAEDQAFKLVVNGQWIGSGQLYAIEGDAAAAITEGETGTNLTLKAGKAYDIVAFWANPSSSVSEGWLIEITENTTVGIGSVRATSAPKAIYNVSGQRLQDKQRGVNIIDGKKTVVK